ncbi:uncharacterized protein, partial [Brachyistius frenatus]|uniref:uncharacterized protein n=1 Tax=Brachyistius frenatus TaxID=100188 RepID=UPI0037E8DDCC
TTIFFSPSRSRNYCKHYHNITEFSKKITLFKECNMSVEVFENKESANCTKAVFKGSPKSLLRCGPPNNVSFRRLSGGLDVYVNWQQEDIKDVEFYSVRYEAVGSLGWSEVSSLLASRPHSGLVLGIHKFQFCSQSNVETQNGRRCRVENLTSSLTYIVQVGCVVNEKCSQCPWSEAYSVPLELTTQPVIVNFEDTDIAGKKGCRLISVTWKFPATELYDGFHVTVGKASGEAPRERVTTSRPEIALVLSHSAYRVDISAVNNVSVSPAASRAIPRREDTPGADDGRLNVTVHSNSSFTIYWKDALIQTYVCYSVEWREAGRNAVYMSFYQSDVNYRTLFPLPGKTFPLLRSRIRMHRYVLEKQVFVRSVTIRLVLFKYPEPLEPYKRYSITLHTRPNKEPCNLERINASESTYGSTQFYFVEGSPVGAPATVSSSNATLKSVALRWSPIPEEDVRGFLRGYVIHYSEYRHGGTPAENNITVAPEVNSSELGDLKSDTAYRVQVSGVTSAGEGVRSTASYFKTKHEGNVYLGGIIAVFAVVTTLLIFASPIIKRAKVVLWPSIPNPGKSTATQKISRSGQAGLAEAINTEAEEWDTECLQVIEKDVARPADASTPTLPLLRASDAAGGSPEMNRNRIRGDADDATGDTGPDDAADTLPDGADEADLQSSPFAHSSDYTTMEMFRQVASALAGATRVAEGDPEDSDFAAGKSRFDYVRQFSTSPVAEGEDIL